jgi:hypothetical protein
MYFYSFFFCSLWRPNIICICIIIISILVVNECATGANDCSPFSMCIDSSDGYACVCIDGFVDTSAQLGMLPGRKCSNGSRFFLEFLCPLKLAPNFLGHKKVSLTKYFCLIGLPNTEYRCCCVTSLA